MPSTHLKDMAPADPQPSAPADPQPAASVPDTTYTMPAQNGTEAVTKEAVADYAARAPDELRCVCVSVCVRVCVCVCVTRNRKRLAVCGRNTFMETDTHSDLLFSFKKGDQIVILGDAEDSVMQMQRKPSGSALLLRCLLG